MSPAVRIEGRKGERPLAVQRMVHKMSTNWLSRHLATETIPAECSNLSLASVPGSTLTGLSWNFHRCGYLVSRANAPTPLPVGFSTSVWSTTLF